MLSIHTIHVAHLVVVRVVLTVILLILLLLSIHVHHRLLVLLDRRQVSGRAAHAQLLVLKLSLLELTLNAGNSQIHELKLFPLLILVLFAEVGAVLVLLHELDVFLELLLFLAHLVDSLNQLYIVLHKASVVLAMLLQVT